MPTHHNLKTTSESIENIYRLFQEGRLLVNRRYQRKLVWSIEEKVSFIDSIKKGFPVPLILLAEVKGEEKIKFEIIDGMQRLNAIISFLEGEFSVDGSYFDLDTMASTKSKRDKNELKQETPLTPRVDCVAIVGYNLAWAVYPGADPTEIDEIFRRINANGRHLSRQELRAAGVTTDFSQLVRKISSNIRNDASSTDTLDLDAMKKISITSKKLEYGIPVETIFWVKHKILKREDIRNSKDEELVADMLGYILLNSPKPPSSADELDRFFGYSQGEPYSAQKLPPLNPQECDGDDNDEQAKKDQKNRLDAAISQLGLPVVEKRLMETYDTCRKIIDSSGKGFVDILFGKGASPKSTPRYFQAFFLAVYELLHGSENQPGRRLTLVDENKAAQNISTRYKLIDVGEGGWRVKASKRNTNVDVVSNLLASAFRERYGEDPMSEPWVSGLERILSQSNTESSLHEYKQGLFRLDGSQKIDEGVFEKILKTICAIANHSSDATGYIFVGVAENKRTAQIHQDQFKSDAPPEFSNFFITGIDSEALLSSTRQMKDDSDRKNSIGEYLMKIKQKIDSSKLSDPLKSQVKRDLKTINYHGRRNVLLIQIKGCSEPSFLGDECYVRDGAETILVSARQMADVIRRLQS